ncbi:tetratricopeptide repeat protein [Carboxylicivirga litoralis]|uniref:tetratricopeptide repeat protein n=1 Tax=Carboxylicivirga litoralis TaxID=2816963 RepID=UPI0021CB1C46|nr:hypothetical protein [Carboxylicivirga sp. A043]
MDYKINYHIHTDINHLVMIGLLFLLSFNTDAQCNADSLFRKEHYLSAFECLSNSDSSLTVEQSLLKVELAMNYHLNCQYYREFSFVDLRIAESLEELRQSKAYGATPFEFYVDSFLLKLQDENPGDYRVAKALGDFYNRVYYDFGDSWGERAEVLLEKSNSYYLQAYEHGVFDYYSLYALGYYQSLFQNYFEAQNWFLKSLNLKPDAALTNYSLAVTYLFDGLPQKGIRYSEHAFKLYTDSIEKSDAARITGILFLKNQEVETANDYFEKADSLHANYRPNQMYLLKTSLLLENDSACIELGTGIILDAPYSPEVPEEFNSMFLQEDKAELLGSIYKNSLDALADNYEACGNIRFHYGKLLFKAGQKRKAKRMIKDSKTDFEKVFDNTHQVFDAIEQTLDRL